MTKKPYKVEYVILDTVERDRGQYPTFHTRYSVHGDLEKAQKSLRRALRQPGSAQYAWRIRHVETGDVWVWFANTWTLEPGPNRLSCNA